MHDRAVRRGEGGFHRPGGPCLWNHAVAPFRPLGDPGGIIIGKETRGPRLFEARTAQHLPMTCNGMKFDSNDVAYLLMHRLHRLFPVETLLGWIYGTGLPEKIVQEVLLGLLPEGCPQW